MLAGTNDLVQCRVRAQDGPLGHIHDLSFDERTWQIRHLILDTEGWLARRVVMHPLAVRRCDPRDRIIELTVTRRQIEQGPPIDPDQPLSLGDTERYYRHFAWPPYWPALGRGFAGEPRLYHLSASGGRGADSSGAADDRDPHLWSARRLLGFDVDARDGRAGRIDDGTIDTSTWMIRQLVIDTRSWWFGKKVLVSPESTARIDWPAQLLVLDLDLEELSRNPTRLTGPLVPAAAAGPGGR